MPLLVAVFFSRVLKLNTKMWITFCIFIWIIQKNSRIFVQQLAIKLFEKQNKMTNIFKNTIIAQAITLGFDFEQFEEEITVEEINRALVDFFNENSEKLERLEDECEVTNNGRTQHVSYGDFWSDGEIVDFSSNWHKAPETKVFHSDFVMEDNGLMKNMNLYYLVGETDCNAPDGYYFNTKTKSHEKIEEEEENA